MTIHDQIAKLAALDNGWYDEDSRALSKEGLEWLEKLLCEAATLGMPQPHLYPMPDDGVQAEWAFRDGANAQIDVEAEFPIFHVDTPRCAMMRVLNMRTVALSTLNSLWTNAMRRRSQSSWRTHRRWQRNHGSRHARG